MEKFIVSARKYRPQTFDTVVGQAHITTTLKNAIKNEQLAHAFLFCGPRGVGKTTCARILAKTINCENPLSDGEACNQCNNCQTFNEGSSFNIHELDAASNNSVDDIRTLVEQVRFAPQAGKYKVYIVDEVHMLSSSAFNAFLKTLEEPPSYAIFILATTEKHKILPTILSRCQIFDFKRITANDTVEHLQQIAAKEAISADKASLQIIAQKSEGCMRDALSILDKIVSFTNGALTYQNTLEHLNILDHDYYFKLLDYLQQQKLDAVLLLIDEVNKKGFEGDLVLNGFAEFLRNILVCKDANAVALLDVVEGMQEKYKSTAKSVSTSWIVSALNILGEAEMNYKMARNKRLHAELCFIKLNYLTQAIDITAEGGNVVKKKRLDGAVAIKTKTVAAYGIVQSPTTRTKPAVSAAALYIEKENPPPPLVAETPSATLPAGVAKTEKKAETPVKKKGKNLLDAIREETLAKKEAVQQPEPLTAEKLMQLWMAFADSLEQQQKYSSSATFRAAKVEVVDDNFFTATVDAVTQQKFIEGEKGALAEQLFNAFYNRNIRFDVLINPQAANDQPKPLSSRERFEFIAAKYPAVAKLKESLKLDITF